MTELEEIHEKNIKALMQPRKVLFWTFIRTRKNAIKKYETRPAGWLSLKEEAEWKYEASRRLNYR